MSLLSPKLKMGAAGILVKDLSAMLDFYRNILGLDLIEEASTHTILGFKKEPIVDLIVATDLSKAEKTSAGLYHIAILFSSRKRLAQAVYSVISKSPHLFTGSADHLVSEAFYMNDPEGNGIELYFDKDPKTWQWDNNRVQMESLYLDPIQYIPAHMQTPDNDQSAQLGHIHLKVGDIEKAKQFYVNILGLDLTAELPGALFVSVGGYHHHLGMNTWESNGAKKRNTTLGLSHFELIVPKKEDLIELKKRLTKHAITLAEKEQVIITHDPWHNEIHIHSDIL